MSEYLCVSDDVVLGQNVSLSKFINLYGCTIGDNTKIGAFVEVQKNATIGKGGKVSSHTFIYVKGWRSRTRFLSVTE